MTNHTQRPIDSVTLKAIYAASARIKTTVCRTPLEPSQALSALAEAEVRLKMENLQHTGSFKIRGAANVVASLNTDQRMLASLPRRREIMDWGLPARVTQQAYRCPYFCPVQQTRLRSPQ